MGSLLLYKIHLALLQTAGLFLIVITLLLTHTHTRYLTIELLKLLTDEGRVRMTTVQSRKQGNVWENMYTARLHAILTDKKVWKNT